MIFFKCRACGRLRWDTREMRGHSSTLALTNPICQTCEAIIHTAAMNKARAIFNKEDVENMADDIMFEIFYETNRALIKKVAKELEGRL